MARSLPKNFHLSLVLLFICCVVPPAYSALFEIPQGLLWFKSDKPLSLTDLKGKFVLVYFWNHGGMNLQSVLDQCEQLQNKFPLELVVLGIHSGKELDPDTINARVADAIGRYNISSPVAVDAYMTALKAFRLDRWPATVLFAPDGSRIHTHTGEREIFSLFSRLIEKKLPRYKETLNTVPIVFQTAPTVSIEAEPQVKSVKSDDLAEKSLGDRLLGETVLDGVEEAAVIEADPSERYPYGSVDEQKLYDQKTVDFHEKDFVGEIFPINREYSRKIGKIILDLLLPSNARWQEPGQSYVRVFTSDGVVLTEALIGSPHMELLINREATADRLYVEVMLYYCAEGSKSVCFMKPLVFKLPLGKYLRNEDIRIEHRIEYERL